MRRHSRSRMPTSISEGVGSRCLAADADAAGDVEEAVGRATQRPGRAEAEVVAREAVEVRTVAVLVVDLDDAVAADGGWGRARRPRRARPGGRGSARVRRA